jgi:hypothetical protein
MHQEIELLNVKRGVDLEIGQQRAAICKNFGEQIETKCLPTAPKLIIRRQSHAFECLIYSEYQPPFQTSARKKVKFG